MEKQDTSDLFVHPTMDGVSDLASAEPNLLASEDALTVAQNEAQLLQQQIEQLNDQLLRGQAEVQNIRRRMDEEVAKARKFSIETFAESLLPVVDSLEAGLAIQEATIEQIREGAQATLRQLKVAFERHKLFEIAPAVGVPFDPHQHQAISVACAEPGREQGPNTVVTVLQKGYQITDRVLRPALVTVTASS
jgi:molecular chaperone GrpE